MNLNIKKQMFEKINEKARTITIILLTTLKIDMLGHLTLKKDNLDILAKLGQLRNE